MIELATLATILIAACVSAVAQQQPPKVTRPSASSVQATPRTSPSPYGSAANAATGVNLPAGSITGFVYWQMNVFQPQSDCQGLSVKIITVNNSGMPLQLLSTTSALTASGPLTDYSAMGAPKYMLCSYSFHNMPEKTSLRALLYGMPTSVSVAIPAAFQIPGGNCSSTPSSTLSFILSGGPMLCGDGAYNINFKLTAPASSIERSPVRSQLVPNAGGPPHGLLAQPQNPSANSDAGRVAGKPTLLSAGPGTSSPTSTQAAQQEKPGQVVAAGPTRPATTGTNRSVTLTNADVARMLKAGLAESVIISSIRSAKKNFDFSPAGCRALQRARVSTGILAAMGDGGVRPCGDVTRDSPSDTPGSTTALNPQSLPPGSKAVRGNHTALKPIKLAPPKALRKTINPRLAEQTASIVAILQQQREVAQTETVAMKASIRSAASVRAPVGTNFKGGSTVQNLGPEMTQDEKGNLTSKLGHAPVFNSIVIMCSQDPSPRIFQLSGGESHGILTPEAKYNLYTITGCGFGPSDPGNSAYIFGVNGFKANLNIDFWSDNGITAHLDPWLAGVLDQNNVTLVVAPAGKQPFNKSGYEFYAARGMPAPDGSDQEVQLAYDSMGQSSIAIGDSSPVLAAYDQLPSNAQSEFPSFSFLGAPVAGWIFRYAYGHRDTVLASDCYINDVHFDDDANGSGPCATYLNFGRQPREGNDTWDFSKLVPGFHVSSYNLYYEDADASTLCGAWDDLSKESGLGGNWNFDMATPSQITVGWAEYYCHDLEFSGRVSQQYQSAYGLAIWVLGPRCVDPWTGQKDQACMSKVKQMLS